MKLEQVMENAPKSDELDMAEFIEQEMGFIKSKVVVKYAKTVNGNIRNLAFAVMGVNYSAWYDTICHKWAIETRRVGDD